MPWPASVNPVTHISPPPPPYGTNLAAMNGSNPNGTWSLFIQDDTVFDSGVISNGWILTLTTANPVGSAADNVLGMTASPTNIVVNRNVIFYLTVMNYGPSDSSNVMVMDTLPLGVTLVSNIVTQGSVNGLVWNLGTLSNNASALQTLTVQANTSGSNFVNFAIVSATTPDPNLDENSASVTFNVSSVAQPIQFTNLVVSSGAFQFTVTGQPGQEYIVQASTNLLNWVTVYTNPPPYNSPFIYTNSSAASYPALFYRVVGVPPWP